MIRHLVLTLIRVDYRSKLTCDSGVEQQINALPAADWSSAWDRIAVCRPGFRTRRYDRHWCDRTSDRLRVCKVFGLSQEVFEAHDAGAVDDGVEGWQIVDQLDGKGANANGILDVKDGGGHTRVRGDGVVEELFATVSDDDLGAEFMEGFREAATYTGAAARDKDRVISAIHIDEFSPELIVGFPAYLR
jgi:hypothetical protein